MTDLPDYSGEFKPDLKLEDFSKDALKRLALANAKCYMTMDGLWKGLVSDRFGEELARELELQIWGKKALPPEARQICKALNIEGDDVATLFKLFQVQPAFVGEGFDLEFELKDRNHGTCKVNKCLFIDYCERHGLDFDWVKYVCEVVDQAGFEAAAHYFNQRMIVTPLKLPQSMSERGCVFEYKIP